MPKKVGPILTNHNNSVPVPKPFRVVGDVPFAAPAPTSTALGSVKAVSVGPSAGTKASGDKVASPLKKGY